MTKLDKFEEAKAVLLATLAAALFISVALVAAPTPASGNAHAAPGSQQLVVVGEVLVAVDESTDGPGVSESALAIVPVESRDAQ